MPAFTLLELLAVIAIIGVLAALVGVAATGAHERSRRSRARAELAVLTQALEAYRSRFGDYPCTGPAANVPGGIPKMDDGPGILFNALVGRRGPGADLVAVEARCFVPLATFELQSSDRPLAGSPGQVANAFLDPWGRRYLYFHRTGPAWARSGPLLLSAGPDGAVALPADLSAWDGAMPAAASANADNLLATVP